MNSLDFVVSWFMAQCNGDWEHDIGIRIATLDNPGWSVTVRIEDTQLDGTVTDWHVVDGPGDSWLHWRATGRMFEARCGPGDLVRALDHFRSFAAHGER